LTAAKKKAEVDKKEDSARLLKEAEAAVAGKKTELARAAASVQKA